jgi:hypothetical protein
MAKKQTRRSISVSRVTYERLKAFCETNGISMSQFVETRVGDFLGEGAEGDSPTAQTIVASFHNHSHSQSQGGNGNGNGQSHGTSSSGERAERPALSPVGPRAGMSSPAHSTLRPVTATSMSSITSGSSAAPAPRAAAPITSAAARFAVEPPPPIIKPRADQPAPPVAPRTADQIFTF